MSSHMTTYTLLYEMKPIKKPNLVNSRTGSARRFGQRETEIVWQIHDAAGAEGKNNYYGQLPAPFLF